MHLKITTSNLDVGFELLQVRKRQEFRIYVLRVLWKWRYNNPWGLNAYVHINSYKLVAEVIRIHVLRYVPRQLDIIIILWRIYIIDICVQLGNCNCTHIIMHVCAHVVDEIFYLCQVYIGLLSVKDNSVTWL